MWRSRLENGKRHLNLNVYSNQRYPTVGRENGSVKIREIIIIKTLATRCRFKSPNYPKYSRLRFQIIVHFIELFLFPCIYNIFIWNARKRHTCVGSLKKKKTARGIKRIKYSYSQLINYILNLYFHQLTTKEEQSIWKISLWNRWCFTNSISKVAVWLEI